MSRYQELSQRFQNFLDEHARYKDEGRKAVSTALDGLANYLDVPSEMVRFFPVGEDYNRDAIYNAYGAAKCDEKGWWGASLAFEPNLRVPGAALLFTLWAFVAPDVIKFRAGDSGVLLEIPRGKIERDSLLPLYEGAFQRALTFMDNRAVEALIAEYDERGSPRRPIGFVWPPKQR